MQENGRSGEKMRKNSIKNTRVNAEVQRELSSILRGGIRISRSSHDFGCCRRSSAGSKNL